MVMALAEVTDLQAERAPRSDGLERRLDLAQLLFSTSKDSRCSKLRKEQFYESLWQSWKRTRMASSHCTNTWSSDPSTLLALS